MADVHVLAHPLSRNKETGIFTGFFYDQEKGWDVTVRFRPGHDGLVLDEVALSSHRGRHGDTTIVAVNR